MYTKNCQTFLLSICEWSNFVKIYKPPVIFVLDSQHPAALIYKNVVDTAIIKYKNLNTYGFRNIFHLK